MNGTPANAVLFKSVRPCGGAPENQLKLISDARNLRLEGLEKERAYTAYEWFVNNLLDSALYMRPPYPGRIFTFSERCTRKILQSS